MISSRLSVALMLAVAALCTGLGLVIGLAFSAGKGSAGNVELAYFEDRTVSALTYKPVVSPFNVERKWWTTLWFSSGEVRKQVEYLNGNPTGRERLWDPSGLLREEISLDSSGRRNYRSYDPDGAPLGFGVQIDQFAGINWLLLDKAGKPFMAYFVIRGVPEGNFTGYHPTGAIAACGEFRAGTRIGEWEYFDETGEPATDAEIPDRLRRSLPRGRPQP